LLAYCILAFSCCEDKKEQPPEKEKQELSPEAQQRFDEMNEQIRSCEA